MFGIPRKKKQMVPELEFTQMIKNHIMNMPKEVRMAYLVRMLWKSKYGWGSEIVGDTDCSGSVTFALYLMGYNIRVTAHGLYNLISEVQPEFYSPQAGDLAFWWAPDGERIKHVAVFSDNGILMNAANEFEDTAFADEKVHRGTMQCEVAKVNWDRAKEIGESGEHSYGLDSELRPLFGLFAKE